MKEEDQRIAIAEACGWHIAERVHADAKPAACMCWVRPGGEEWHEERLPDYLNDLNAMHEAVRSLPDERQPYYMKHLFYVLIEQKGDAGVSDFDKHLASASVCAEAFLKTIGKWTDDK